MKTALQEFIEWSENDLELFIEDTDEALRIYETIKIKATELLEKEKEQIVTAIDKSIKCNEEVAKGVIDSCYRITGKKYYNETFKQ